MKLLKSFLILLFILGNLLFLQAQNYTGSFTFRTTLYSIKSEHQDSGAFKVSIEENSNKKTILH